VGECMEEEDRAELQQNLPVTNEWKKNKTRPSGLKAGIGRKKKSFPRF